jgi:hypothetical protein
MPTISEPSREEHAAMPAAASAPLASPIDLPAHAALPMGAARRRSQSPTKGLQRAPTLPPLNVSGRASQTFAGTAYDGDAAPGAKPQHLSTSSSLNNDESAMLDSFPEIPTAGVGPHQKQTLLSGTSTPVKRTSSLIAGKDSELFAALKLSDQDELR